MSVEGLVQRQMSDGVLLDFYLQGLSVRFYFSWHK